MKRPVAIVTGGGRGIGRAVCLQFASNGVAVVAAARSPDELADTRRMVHSIGGVCETRVTDVSLPNDVHALVESTIATFGGVDVLVNNAGIAPQATIDDLDDAVFQNILLVNVSAVYRCCRAVWPVMKKSGGGSIINISSVASVDPFPGFAAYGAAKTWVNAWTRALAEEGRPHGIRVFSVAPGAVETRMLRDPFPNFPKDQALAPSDIAEVVFTLTQPSCKFATGNTVFVRK